MNTVEAYGGHKLYGFLVERQRILSAEHKDEPLDFGTLNKTGCFIESAAIIVLSDKDKARDYALNAMKFLSEKVAVNALLASWYRKSYHANAVRIGIKIFKDISNVMRDASICGLGQTAVNPLTVCLSFLNMR